MLNHSPNSNQHDLSEEALWEAREQHGHGPGISPYLPVHDYKDVIVDLVHSSPVVVVVAETGAGKSTQIPQMLLDNGYENVLVTEPRILAAKSLAERVSYERNEPLGGEIGYQTAMQKDFSPDTRCTYCTDGFALVRELLGTSPTPDVLVLDEVHEWNLNIEILLAWARREAKHRNFKLVLMSATVDAEAISKYCGDAPIVTVPGRTYPVDELQSGETVVSDARRLLKKGHNVLIFQPGKSEIEETIEALEDSRINAQILALHSELTPQEQALCFEEYDVPKCIVATDIAQTSITIADITAVIDSGLKREMRVVDGVEGLYITSVSKAESEQRRGRAGRTQPGVYIDHGKRPFEKRKDYPSAEINRVQLDQAVLRLAIFGENMEDLNFFHQPDRKAIQRAREKLVTLGCMEEDGTVTDIGQKVAKLPVSARIGRMIVESEKLGVVDDIITIAAIHEANDIIDRKTDEWRDLAEGENRSDSLAQLKIFKRALQMSSDHEREYNGIHLRRFQKAVQIRDHIISSLRGIMPEPTTTGNPRDIMRSIFAGSVDHVYYRVGNKYINDAGDSREIGFSSVVEDAEVVTGIPFDLEIPAKKKGQEGRTLNLLTAVTRVDPDWLD